MYRGSDENLPLIVLNNYSGESSSVIEAMKGINCPECNLLCISGLNWDHDMTPWYCPPLSENDTPCTGGADEYLKLLLSEILPEAKARINGKPSFIGLAGYSLAGLFAIYALYQTDAFARVASMSGSLWFPGFRDYCLSHELKGVPDRLYLSLGDREARTKNKMLMTVQDNTEVLAEHYQSFGLDVVWELNPGNHFRDAALRSAKGIKALLVKS